MNNENNQAEYRQQSENATSEPKKVRYQINWNKFGALIGGAMLVIISVVVGWWFFSKMEEKEGSAEIYNVAVMLKDQTQEDPEEDMKNSLKAGDVALVLEIDRKWSKTERISYLIIKMKLKKDEVAKLTEPETKKLSEKEAKEKGLIQGEEMEKEEFEEQLIQTVRARKYRIKIEELEFDPMKVREGQPFPDREFTWDVVEKK